MRLSPGNGSHPAQPIGRRGPFIIRPAAGPRHRGRRADRQRIRDDRNGREHGVSRHFDRGGLHGIILKAIIAAENDNRTELHVRRIIVDAFHLRRSDRKYKIIAGRGSRAARPIVRRRPFIIRAVAAPNERGGIVSHEVVRACGGD